MTRFILFFLIIVFAGCHKGEVSNNDQYTKVDLTSLDEDFVMPSSLWRTLEAAYPELTVMAAAPKAEGEEKSEKKEGESKKPDPKTEEAKKRKKSFSNEDRPLMV